MGPGDAPAVARPCRDIYLFVHPPGCFQPHNCRQPSSLPRFTRLPPYSSLQSAAPAAPLRHQQKLSDHLYLLLISLLQWVSPPAGCSRRCPSPASTAAFRPPLRAAYLPPRAGRVFFLQLPCRPQPPLLFQAPSNCSSTPLPSLIYCPSLQQQQDASPAFTTVTYLAPAPELPPHQACCIIFCQAFICNPLFSFLLCVLSFFL
ncbi:uncharacterized protein LOC110032357 [Phalaenopsis equestris]|uniref:uncharacterized protein LOC110032357 n=1 Tax=Phalaenopsis equestris TaxID=78828 RepID=UPI0009E56533|nr:uncharacterized protein LOC110032357 [Phalaenopsis equestris]